MRCMLAGLACTVAACSFHDGVVPGDGTMTGDGSGSAIDGGPCVSWQALNVDPCAAPLGTPAPLQLSPGVYTLNADDATVTGDASLTLPGALVVQANGPMARVINVTSLDIAANANVLVTGTHPVIFVVHGDAAIAGSLIASARTDADTATKVAGPGGDGATACAIGVADSGGGTSGMGGGGGGGGGGYGDDGADGTDGSDPSHGAHGGHGKANGVAAITPLRGGCPGGAGGADAVVGGPAQGRGGGALEITALGTISVTGTLAAGGSGGATFSGTHTGGGGGGAGGAILLDGDTAIVLDTAKLCANGGGGGEGGQILSTSAGGQPAACAPLPALGGAINGDGGDGGDGGYAGTAAVKGGPAKNGAGGGGGGGSFGRIRVHGRTMRTVNASAIVTPLPSS
jgi:hypothetical protein